MQFDTVPIADPVDIKGVLFPRGVTFNQIVVTGPPGSGKSDMICRLGGWPQEGYVDLTQKGWWHARVLSYRPCQIHLGIPCTGFRKARPVTDTQWLAATGCVDSSCIMMPSVRRSSFGPDWHRRHVFVFLLPPPVDVYRARSERARCGTHPVDRGLSCEQVERQYAAYGEVAGCLVAAGFQVLIRESFGGPLRILGGEANACQQGPAADRMVGAMWTLLC